MDAAPLHRHDDHDHDKRPGDRHRLRGAGPGEERGRGRSKARANRPPVAVGDILPQMLLVDTSRTIDSTPYFYDPDGDPLTYVVVDVSDPTIATAETSSPPLTMTGFSTGETTGRLEACDPRGACARQDFRMVVVNWAILVPSTLKMREGDSKTYTMKLELMPAGEVTVRLTSRDPGAVSVSPAVLTFTPDDWNTSETVTVHGVEDDDITGEAVVIDHEASGGGYDGLTVGFLVTVEDDDEPGVTISAAEVAVDEGATAAEAYTVALDAQPAGAVTVTATSDDPGAASVSPAVLMTFTPDDWNTPRAVSVTGVADDDAARHRVAEHWLVRFGRTAANNALNLIGERFDASPSSAATRITIADRPIPIGAVIRAARGRPCGGVARAVGAGGDRSSGFPGTHTAARAVGRAVGAGGPGEELYRACPGRRFRRLERVGPGRHRRLRVGRHGAGGQGRAGRDGHQDADGRAGRSPGVDVAGQGRVGRQGGRLRHVDRVGGRAGSDGGGRKRPAPASGPGGLLRSRAGLGGAADAHVGTGGAP